MGQQVFRNAGDLLGRLARSINDLGDALAQPPMVIQLGIAQIIVGLRLQAQQRLFHIHLTLANALQQAPCFMLIHVKLSRILSGYLAFRSNKTWSK